MAQRISIASIPRQKRAGGAQGGPQLKIWNENSVRGTDTETDIHFPNVRRKEKTRNYCHPVGFSEVFSLIAPWGGGGV